MTCIRTHGRLPLIVRIRYSPTNHVGGRARNILSYLQFSRLGRTRPATLAEVARLFHSSRPAATPRRPKVIYTAAAMASPISLVVRD
jgi:hypothetical protein